MPFQFAYPHSHATVGIVFNFKISGFIRAWTVVLGNATVDLAAGLTKEQFDNLVFRERGYEFICESKRWFDMKRTGKAAGIAVAAGRPAPTRLNWFIPNIEIANNPLIK